MVRNCQNQPNWGLNAKVECGILQGDYITRLSDDKMLTPSERIDTIQEIASRLSKEDWPLIDLTLRQFSLPWTEEWQGDERAYIFNMLDDAPNETLVDLAAHLGYDNAHERPGVEPDFWKVGHFRLFASHLAEDKDYATQLQLELSRFYISTFVAHKDINPTREWQEEIELALSTADALVALLTPGFHASLWTDQEVGFAMGRGLLAVAISLGEEPYGFIARLQAFQGIGKTVEELAREMFQAFLRNKQTKRRLTLAFLNRFENSHSFDNAKENMSLLEGIDYWELHFEERIRKAVDSNYQLRKAWGVPERAESLIRKWTK